MSDMKLPASLLRTDPGLVAQQLQPATPLMSRQLIDMLFVGMARCPEFFDECRRFIKPSYFPAWEAQYQVLYHVMCELRPHHRMFNYTLLHIECYDFISRNLGVCDEQQALQLLQKNSYGLLFHIFTLPSEEIDLAQCRRYLQRFLMERVIATPLRQFMSQVSDQAIPERLTEFLDLVQDRRREIQAAVDLPVVDIVPDPTKPIKPPAIYNMTGVDFIDGPLGGQREGDANGILGVIGAGKSTLAAHMGVQMAKTEFLRAFDEKRAPRLSVIFTYEEAAEKLQPRIWSAAAQIRRDKLERLTHPQEQLSHAGALEEYELKLAGEGERKEGEFERWVKMSGWLPEVLWIADMSGSEQYPNSGSGYVDEIVSVLEGIKIRSGGKAYLSILIDFAGLVCERYQQINGMDDSRLRHLLKGFGDRCRREISERYRCTTWIFHQIAASNATRSPTQALHHSMAQESRAFAEFLAVCGCLGVPDPTSGCRLLNWSKTRYSRQETIEPMMLRINDLFAQYEDVSEQFRIDDGGRAFVTRSVYNQVHGGQDGENGDDGRTHAPSASLNQSRPHGSGGSHIDPVDHYTSDM